MLLPLLMRPARRLLPCVLSRHLCVLLCFVVHQEVLPVEGVTACVSAFFATDASRERALSNSTSSGSSSDRNGSSDSSGSSGSSSGRRSSGSVSNGRANLFGEAALDLLMVLHARLPSSLKGSTSSSRIRKARATAGQSTVAVDNAHAAARAVTVVNFEGEEFCCTSTAAQSKQTSSAEVSASVLTSGVKGDSGDGCISARGMPAVEAWTMIVRALSLGARSAEREVAAHALQLLTKVRGGENEFYAAWFGCFCAYVVVSR